MRLGISCRVVMAAIIGSLVSWSARAQTFHIESRSEIQVNADLTSQKRVTQDVRILSDRAVATYSQIALTFDPASETVDVVEAWLDQPGGERVTVDKSHVFTRPSAASRDAPGFVDTLTRTIEFPQIQVGSRLHLAIQRNVTRPPLLGFNEMLTGPLGGSLHLSATISYPPEVALQWRQRGAFAVDTSTTEGMRQIKVEFSKSDPSPEPEPHMVALSDVESVFIATSLPSYEALGALYYRQNADKSAVTPNVRQLAQQIAQGRSGIDAARAVYDWVAGNIRYLAVYLDPNSGEVAHTADEILQNRFGDCKDHVVIMQALLAALDIRAEPALVNWDGRMQPLPIWSSAAFNHAMVYLPDFDAYANPTDPYARFEALDIELSNKLVVIATPMGEVRQTPPSAASSNRYHLQASITLAADGTIVGSNRIVAAGRWDTGLRRIVANDRSPQALVDTVLAETAEGGFGSLRGVNPRNLAVPFSIEAQWTSPHGTMMDQAPVPFGVPVGFDLDRYTGLRQYLAPGGTRRYPVLMGAMEATWIYDIRLPDGYTLQSPPPAASIRNAAGSYEATVEPSDSGMRVTRRLVVARDTYSPEEYPAVQELLYGAIDNARTLALLGKP